MMFVRYSVVVILIYGLICSTDALQSIGNVGNGDSTTPAPLCERVNVGTLSVSPMGFGTLNLPLDKEVDDEAFGVLKTASDCGINFVDTAEAVSVILLVTSLD